MLMDELEAMFTVDHEGDWELWNAGVAVAFCDLAESDARWLWWAVDWAPDELVRLVPWLRQIGGMFPPDGMDWVEWIEIGDAHFFTPSAATRDAMRSDDVVDEKPVGDQEKQMLLI